MFGRNQFHGTISGKKLKEHLSESLVMLPVQIFIGEHVSGSDGREASAWKARAFEFATGEAYVIYRRIPWTGSA